MKRTPLQRKTRLRARRSKPEVRIGKHTGKVRLTGRALELLRHACWGRDHLRCKECGLETYWKPRWEGDPLAYDMAHVVSRGAGGSDTLENVRTLCHRCHMREHAGHNQGIQEEERG